MKKQEHEIDKLFNTNEKLERSFSYSRLSDFDRNGPKALIRRVSISGYGIKMGSIIDDLTLPTKGYNFKDHYIISDFEKPTATLGKLIDIILTNYIEVPSKETILEICKNNNFWKRSKEETIINNFDNEEFWGYLKDNIEGNVKNIISSIDYEKGKYISNILLTHKNTEFIFKNDCENINQLKFTFNYKGIDLRGIIDRVVIDHKNKTIRFIDLKTGKDDALNFMNSFLKYRYYLQESVYVQAFKSICKMLDLKKYSMLPFQFLYISRSEQVPILYTINKKWHKCALNGFKINHYTYKGLNQLIDDVKWHFKTNSFELPREIEESNGEIILKDSFIEYN